MVRVIGQRTRGIAVKRLGIQQRFDQPLFVQIDHRAGDPAQTKAGGNVVTTHLIFEETGHRQRCAAGPRLQRETVFEIARVFDHLRRLAGDQQFARVAGQTDRPGGDFRRIADLIDLHDQIHPILGDAGRIVWIIYPLFGEQHHASGGLGIHSGVAQRSAAGFTAKAVGVAIFIAARHAEERHINA